MIFMLRACAYSQKRFKNFNHLKCRILSYVIHDYNFEVRIKFLYLSRLLLK